jgi:hypothetical protein
VDIVSHSTDRNTGPAVKRVSRAITTAARTGYSEHDITTLRHAMRRTGAHTTRRQIANLLTLAARSAA